MVSSTRLSALDASFLSVEADTAPMHIGALLLLRSAEPAELPPGLDRIMSVVRRRTARVPQLRRRLNTPRVPWAPLE